MKKEIKIALILITTAIAIRQVLIKHKYTLTQDAPTTFNIDVEKMDKLLAEFNHPYLDSQFSQKN